MFFCFFLHTPSPHSFSSHILSATSQANDITCLHRSDTISNQSPLIGYNKAGIKSRSVPIALGTLHKIRDLESMSKVCQVTGKRPQSGNNVSHAHNKTRRRFLPNLQYKRFWVESEKRYVRLRISQKGLRIIDKHGIDKILADLRADGQRV